MSTEDQEPLLPRIFAVRAFADGGGGAPSAGDTVDGVVVAPGDRVVVMVADGAAAGLWTVPAADGDAAAALVVPLEEEHRVLVREGRRYGGGTVLRYAAAEGRYAVERHAVPPDALMGLDELTDAATVAASGARDTALVLGSTRDAATTLGPRNTLIGTAAGAALGLGAQENTIVGAFTGSALGAAAQGYVVIADGDGNAALTACPRRGTTTCGVVAASAASAAADGATLVGAADGGGDAVAVGTGDGVDAIVVAGAAGARNRVRAGRGVKRLYSSAATEDDPAATNAVWFGGVPTTTPAPTPGSATVVADGAGRTALVARSDTKDVWFGRGGEALLTGAGAAAGGGNNVYVGAVPPDAVDPATDANTFVAADGAGTVWLWSDASLAHGSGVWLGPDARRPPRDATFIGSTTGTGVTGAEGEVAIASVAAPAHPGMTQVFADGQGSVGLGAAGLGIVTGRAGASTVAVGGVPGASDAVTPAAAGAALAVGSGGAGLALYADANRLVMRPAGTFGAASTVADAYQMPALRGTSEEAVAPSLFRNASFREGLALGPDEFQRVPLAQWTTVSPTVNVMVSGCTVFGSHVIPSGNYMVGLQISGAALEQTVSGLRPQIPHTITLYACERVMNAPEPKPTILQILCDGEAIALGVWPRVSTARTGVTSLVLTSTMTHYVGTFVAPASGSVTVRFVNASNQGSYHDCTVLFGDPMLAVEERVGGVWLGAPASAAAYRGAVAGGVMTLADPGLGTVRWRCDAAGRVCWSTGPQNDDDADARAACPVTDSGMTLTVVDDTANLGPHPQLVLRVRTPGVIGGFLERPLGPLWPTVVTAGARARAPGLVRTWDASVAATLLANSAGTAAALNASVDRWLELPVGATAAGSTNAAAFVASVAGAARRVSVPGVLGRECLQLSGSGGLVYAFEPFAAAAAVAAAAGGDGGAALVVRPPPQLSQSTTLVAVWPETPSALATVGEFAMTVVAKGPLDLSDADGSKDARRYRTACEVVVTRTLPGTAGTARARLRTVRDAGYGVVSLTSSLPAGPGGTLLTLGYRVGWERIGVFAGASAYGAAPASAHATFRTGLDLYDPTPTTAVLDPLNETECHMAAYNQSATHVGGLPPSANAAINEALTPAFGNASFKQDVVLGSNGYTESYVIPTNWTAGQVVVVASGCAAWGAHRTPSGNHLAALHKKDAFLLQTLSGFDWPYVRYTLTFYAARRLGSGVAEGSATVLLEVTCNDAPIPIEVARTGVAWPTAAASTAPLVLGPTMQLYVGAFAAPATKAATLRFRNASAVAVDLDAAAVIGDPWVRAVVPSQMRGYLGEVRVLPWVVPEDTDVTGVLLAELAARWRPGAGADDGLPAAPQFANASFTADLTLPEGGWDYSSAVSGWTLNGQVMVAESGKAPWGKEVTPSGHRVVGLQWSGRQMQQAVSGFQKYARYVLTVYASGQEAIVVTMEVLVDGTAIPLVRIAEGSVTLPVSNLALDPTLQLYAGEFTTGNTDTVTITFRNSTLPFANCAVMVADPTLHVYTPGFMNARFTDDAIVNQTLGYDVVWQGFSGWRVTGVVYLAKSHNPAFALIQAPDGCNIVGLHAADSSIRQTVPYFRAGGQYDVTLYAAHRTDGTPFVTFTVTVDTGAGGAFEAVPLRVQGTTDAPQTSVTIANTTGNPVMSQFVGRITATAGAHTIKIVNVTDIAYSPIVVVSLVSLTVVC